MNKTYLRRVLLRNWTNFNTILDFSDATTLLQGENGSGKSTVIDAVNLVLSGSKRFNDASNKNNGERNIASAIHNYDRQNDRILRPGPVTAYVILEFYDEKNDHYFLNGIQMTSSGYSGTVNNVNELYFAADGMKLEDVKDDIFSSVPEMQDILKKKSSKIRIMRKKDEAFKYFFKNRRMKETQWMKYEKKNSRVLKAKLDHNGKTILPNEFVKQCVLPDGTEKAKENIESFKQQKQLLSDIEKILTKQDAQRKSLSRMLSLMDTINENESKVFCLEGSQMLLGIDAENKEILRSETESQKLELEIGQARIEAERYGKQRKEANERKDALTIALAKKTSPYKDELARYDGSISLLEKEDENYDCVLHAIKAADERYGYGFKNNLSAEYVAEYMEVLDKKSRYQRERAMKKRDELIAMEAHMKELVKDLDSLKKGIVRPENPSAVSLKEAMNKKLEEIGSHSTAHLVYEMIEFIDPDWQRAIESFLGKRRYALLVEDHYVLDALRLYKSYKNTMIARIRDTYPEVAGNAASVVKIKDDDPLACRYLNSLLKGVKLCETEEELKSAKSGLMKDGRTSSATAYENREAGNVRLVCGQDAIREEKLRKEEERESLLREISDAKKDVSYADSRADDLENLKNILIRNPIANYQVKDDLDDLREQRRILIKKIEEDKDSFEYQKLIDELDDVKLLIESLEKKEKSENDKVSAKSERLRMENGIFEKCTAKIEALMKRFREDFGEKEAEIKDFYLSIDPSDKNKEHIEELIRKTNKTIDAARGKLEREQNDYQVENRTFTKGYDEAAYKRISESYDQVKNIDIADTTKKLEETKVQLLHSKDSFFHSLYKDYLTAMDTIKELNMKLKRVPFCGDTIEIKMDKNADIGRYMTAIENRYGDEIDYDRIGFPREATDTDEQALQALFEKMIHSGREESDRYGNYKNYIKTEVYLRRVVEKGIGPVRLLEKDNQSNSGGQEQMPYYIILAISLLTSFEANEGVRIMLLDECFSKMDKNRMQLVLKFFKEINMQVILSTCRPIYDLVELTHVFNRDKKTTKIQIVSTKYDMEKGITVGYGKEEVA